MGANGKNSYHISLMGIVLVFLILLLPQFSIAMTCGDGICEGRNIVEQQPFDFGLSRENWDNCPQDCGVHPVSRNLADIYHTNEQVYSILDSYEAEFPDLVSKEIIGYSTESNPIYLYKLGNGDWKFMMDSRIHGMEDCGTEVGLEFFDWVLRNSSADAKEVRTNSSFLFIPVLQPDVVKRQNARKNFTDSNGTVVNVTYGVDLNRNFPTRWTLAGSFDPTHAYEYHGPSQGSERETQALISALAKYRPNVYVNTHCGQFKVISVGTNPIDTGIRSKFTNLSSLLGTQTVSIYKPANGYPVHGYSITEADLYSGSSWLLEISNWTELPKSLSEFKARHYKNTFPIILSFAVPLNYIPGSLNETLVVGNSSNNSVNNTPPVNQTGQSNSTNSSIEVNSTINVTSNATTGNNSTINNSTSNSTVETNQTDANATEDNSTSQEDQQSSASSGGRSSGGGGGGSRSLQQQTSNASSANNSNVAAFLSGNSVVEASEESESLLSGQIDAVEQVAVGLPEGPEDNAITGAAIFEPGKVARPGLVSPMIDFFARLSYEIAGLFSLIFS